MNNFPPMITSAYRALNGNPGEVSGAQILGTLLSYGFGSLPSHNIRDWEGTSGNELSS